MSAEVHDDDVFERVRRVPENPHAFRGFGPLLALAVLVLLSIVLAPTVAPEQLVEVPVTQGPAPGSTEVGG